jgi:arylsulfatase A-like enzyme
MEHLSRRAFAGQLAAVTTGISFAQQNSAKPNFVVLYTDDQRFDTIAALGNRHIKTPNLDRLVKRGVAFTHAFTQGGTQGAICIPSRAALMTGRSVFGASRDVLGTKPPVVLDTFPQLLGAAGYETFISGKWHNGPRMLAKSFNHGANIFFGGMSEQFKIELQDFDPSGKYPKERAQTKSGEFASTLFTNSALEFLNQRDRQKPFLLYCPFTSPHDPRTAPKRFADMYNPAAIELPPNFMPEHPFDNGDLRVRDEMLCAHPRVPADVRTHIADYYAMITAVDHDIGRILDALEASGDAANTYIIYAGDNGLAVGQHGLIGKQNLYDHSWRVPLVIAGPGLPRGKRTQALTYLMDLCPTICDFAGIAPPKDLDAASLRPVCTGAKKQLRSHVFATYSKYQRAIRTERFKLIEYNVSGKRTTQLFDLAKDPWELKNLAAAPSHATKVSELRALLVKAMADAADPSTLDSPEWAAI